MLERVGSACIAGPVHMKGIPIRIPNVRESSIPLLHTRSRSHSDSSSSSASFFGFHGMHTERRPGESGGSRPNHLGINAECTVNQPQWAHGTATVTVCVYALNSEPLPNNKLLFATKIYSASDRSLSLQWKGALQTWCDLKRGKQPTELYA